MPIVIGYVATRMHEGGSYECILANGVMTLCSIDLFIAFLYSLLMQGTLIEQIQYSPTLEVRVIPPSMTTMSISSQHLKVI